VIQQIAAGASGVQQQIQQGFAQAPFSWTSTT